MYKLPLDFDALFLHHSEFSNKLCGYNLSDYVYEVSYFTGSKAFIILSHHKKAIFVDARYTLQAKNECSDFEVIECKSLDLKNKEIKEWLEKNLQFAAKIAYDPANISIDQIEKLKRHYPTFTLHPLKIPIKEKNYDIELYPLAYAGQSCKDKIHTLIQKNSQNHPQISKWGLVLSSPESIGWLFNLRAKNWQSFGFSPIFPSLACLTKENTFLFVPSHSISSTLKENLENRINLYQIPCQDFEKKLYEVLCQIPLQILWYDETQTSQKLHELLIKLPLSLSHQSDPVLEQRSIKNPVEIKNSELIHALEGATIVKLIAWIYSSYKNLNERDISQKLEEIRSQNKLYKGPSFKSIVATGPHAAIVHHTPSKKTETPIKPSSILLLDVGGHYSGATTDMTRTIWLGESPAPSSVIDTYTRVLKGHIALAQIYFPKGITGAHLDVLARQFLWKSCQDYAHGTGHGVGNYLAVHEGNFGFSPYSFAKSLEAGMIISNEPGFYKADDYGIRLENLMQICELNTYFLFFKPLTLVPFDEQLIDFKILTNEERFWLQDYHQSLLKKLKPYLIEDQEAWQWLNHCVKKFL